MKCDVYYETSEGLVGEEGIIDPLPHWERFVSEKDMFRLVAEARSAALEKAAKVCESMLQASTRLMAEQPDNLVLNDAAAAIRALKDKS